MRRLSVLVLCSVCLALPLTVGCGGGDDPVPDAGTTPPPPPPPDAGTPDGGTKPDAGPLDLIPPTLVSFTPADGSVAVPPESTIVLTFSEAMQVDRGTVQITPATGLPNGGVFAPRPQDWDAAHKMVTFYFPQGLPLKAQLTVNVSNFADVAGNPMRGLVSFGFSVSDGKPPRVSSASPAEGAASVSLSTSEVSINFSEPMDIAVGTLTPGGGLTLGPTVWTGNQVIKAPITSALVYDANYTVTLSGFRNVNGKDLDGTPYLGDGKLDFATGPDTTAPSVVDASPPEGATGILPENTQFIVITFSEPMDSSVGKAELVDGTKTTVLPPTWSSDGFYVTYDVRTLLRYSATLKVTLTGFKDRAGNSYLMQPYLGDGALNFTTGADTVKPYVISATPADGEQIYPTEVYLTGSNPATATRKIFTFQFNEPMNTSITRVTLHESDTPTSYRNLDGVWSADQRTLTVTVYPPMQGQLPLISGFRYYMDLTELKDLAGNPLDATVPVLGNGRLEFTTLDDYPLMDHACEAALVQTPTAVTATASYSASSPATNLLHTNYQVNLPSNGTSYSGYTKLQLNTIQAYTLFMDRDVTLTIADPAAPNSPLVVSKTAVRSPCAPISYYSAFETSSATTLQVRNGPISDPQFRFVIELGY